jgi:hypothetical protein
LKQSTPKQEVLLLKQSTPKQEVLLLKQSTPKQIPQIPDQFHILDLNFELGKHAPIGNPENASKPQDCAPHSLLPQE